MKHTVRVLSFVLAAVVAVGVSTLTADTPFERVAEQRQESEWSELEMLLERMSRGEELSEGEKFRCDHLSAAHDPGRGSGSPLDNQGGPDGFGYRWVDNQAPDTATFNWIELDNDPQATPVTFPSRDDAVSGLLPIGFSFPFYTGLYDNFRLSTNGTLQFTTSVTSYSNACTPTTLFAGPVIFHFWDDLHLDRGGDTLGTDIVTYRNFGSYTVIQYDSIGFYSTTCIGEVLRYQIILHNDGRIKLQYHTLTIPTGCLNSQTIAIQQAGVAGSNALNYVCNLTGIQPVSGLAIWFFPSATGSIAGTVTEPGGQPVNNARVRINETGAVAFTNANGDYTFPIVGIGTFSLTAYKFGFSSDTENGVVVTEDQTTDVDFTITAQGLLNFSATDLPQAIPSVGLVTSTIEVPQAVSIDELSVMVTITHPNVGDLLISLTSPDNVTAMLSNRRGGTGDNFSGTIFNDNADSSIAQGAPPYSGIYRPDSTLARYINNSIQGTWTLTVEDVVAANVGTLDAWELYVDPGTLTGGSIVGTVTSDATGDPVPGIRVTIQQNGMQRRTGPDGTYSFGLLPAGTYTLNFAGGLYEPVTVPNVVVNTGQATTVNVSLESGFIMYPYTGQPVPVVDDSVFVEIEVPDDFEFTAVLVLINDIQHTWDSDLDIYLRGPDGTQVELSTDNGSTGDNYIMTLFDDDAECLISNTACAVAPFTGTFRPEGQLSTLLGRPSMGTWTLVVDDDLTGYPGTINLWTLILAGSLGPEGTLFGNVQRHSNSQPIQGATVIASNEEETDSTLTDSQGQYLLEMPVGTYTVTFRYTGFCDSVRTGIEVLEDQTTTVSARLRNPVAAASVTSLTQQCGIDDSTTATFTLSNTGNCALTFTVSDNQSWMSAEPAAGTVAAGTNQLITVTLNATGMAVGEYTGMLTVAHNAANTSITIPVQMLVVILDADDVAALPTEYSLAVYPNPFNPVATLRFGLVKAERVTIDVYDVAGRHVRSLSDREFAAGYHAVTFHAGDLPSGLYFGRIRAGEFVRTEKLVLMK